MAFPTNVTKVWAAGEKLRAADLNDNFEEVRAWAATVAALLDGSLAVDQLEDGTAGQVIVAGPTPTWRTVSGALTLNSSGAASLAYHSDTTPSTTMNADGSRKVLITRAAPAAGTWLILAEAGVDDAAGVAIKIDLSLYHGAAELVTIPMAVDDNGAGAIWGQGMVWTVAVLNGTDNVTFGAAQFFGDLTNLGDLRMLMVRLA